MTDLKDNMHFDSQYDTTEFICRISERRHVEHLLNLWQVADKGCSEQGKAMYSRALQGKARLIWAKVGMPVTCPECSSRNVSRPDEDDNIDCGECGIWFNPAHPNNEHCLEFASDGVYDLPEQAGDFPIMTDGKVVIDDSGPYKKIKIVR